MAIFIWCEIVCATCAKTSEGRFTTSHIPRLLLKKSAQREGFVFVGNEAYCSMCAKLLKKGKSSDKSVLA
jgi:hypothetical protein